MYVLLPHQRRCRKSGAAPVHSMLDHQTGLEPENGAGKAGGGDSTEVRESPWTFLSCFWCHKAWSVFTRDFAGSESICGVTWGHVLGKLEPQLYRLAASQTGNLHNAAIEKLAGLRVTESLRITPLALEFQNPRMV